MNEYQHFTQENMTTVGNEANKENIEE